MIITTSVFSKAYALDGFFLDYNDFTKDYRSSATFDEYLAQQYITKHNAKAQEHAQEIVTNIVKAADCMQVDAVYLLAKIHTESTFYIDANSSSGAAGLSQMTGIAIQEVRDQLGIRGSKYARNSVILNLTDTLKTCMGDIEYLKFYNTHKDQTNYQIKQVYKDNIYYSVLAGAIILKVFLAKNYNPHRSLRENYRHALEDYNGESTKAVYAQNIINKGIKIRQIFKQGHL